MTEKISKESQLTPPNPQGPEHAPPALVGDAEMVKNLQIRFPSGVIAPKDGKLETGWTIDDSRTFEEEDENGQIVSRELGYDEVMIKSSDGQTVKVIKTETLSPMALNNLAEEMMNASIAAAKESVDGAFGEAEEEREDLQEPKDPTDVLIGKLGGVENAQKVVRKIRDDLSDLQRSLTVLEKDKLVDESNPPGVGLPVEKKEKNKQPEVGLLPAKDIVEAERKKLEELLHRAIGNGQEVDLKTLAESANRLTWALRMIEEYTRDPRNNIGSLYEQMQSVGASDYSTFGEACFESKLELKDESGIDWSGHEKSVDIAIRNAEDAIQGLLRPQLYGLKEALDSQGVGNTLARVIGALHNGVIDQGIVHGLKQADVMLGDTLSQSARTQKELQYVAELTQTIMDALDQKAVDLKE